MDNLRERLEKVLAEHQRENGSHMIGGRERLVQRLLEALRSSPSSLDNSPGELNGACC